jgi:hypothetical protein
LVAISARNSSKSYSALLIYSTFNFCQGTVKRFNHDEGLETFCPFCSSRQW